MKNRTATKKSPNNHSASRNNSSSNGKKGSNTLRIIGGEWRSRKLQFLDAPGLRPTPDRIRETLFNWLQGSIHGSHCLDLFAGSGAIGLEALSRGAKSVDFVEKNAAASKQLNSNLSLLKSDLTVFQVDALRFLEQHEANQPYDIIFLDPPYRQGLLDKSLELLISKSLINEHSLVYLEHESEEAFDFTKFDLEEIKQASAGQVQSYLLQAIK
ncbi:16S rRNA (guanine(966)-N(2))-methyltransferase RsmD [Cocleimonas sp. KMM 6892]|uniref:16S rRNA (guanine(966)-N(2))-methyltransferase RsmD n=1 Tax=unclassified Cocleimonas TaxID=2639732 RepID=UPI002DB81B3C|nr:MULTISPECIES: 16S rRNA (guanine(966)-N(2))-methyltransferase RsmD [unclassified Cocleimonas]MEB8431175.1 16S rRNA (guanine(966)-N(2))-methyltransferase RsmD [Cocleimonas sp. KMM 6892]MEC4714053.1 16S rRNA (guanine(966)-N(2))-methyltransferase RsmD [Cocleimonas sp. KMM 6895]MEC4743384.1 16S rRNA (guanine(966)-N(2))-methyltransferase RsmD [Cocleimonas sp. KMM 6896]